MLAQRQPINSKLFPFFILNFEFCILNLIGLTQLAQAMPAAGYAYAKLKYICIIQVMQLGQGDA